MEEINLTNSEWYVLDCLWEKSPMTVMELVGALGERLGWAKSTTITTLRRMEEKGLLRVEPGARGKLYAPAVERERAAMEPLRARADYIITTTTLPVRKLRGQVLDMFTTV